MLAPMAVDAIYLRIQAIVLLPARLWSDHRLALERLILARLDGHFEAKVPSSSRDVDNSVT